MNSNGEELHDAWPGVKITPNRDSLKVNVAAGQLALGSTEPADGTVHTQDIARWVMHSELL
jgi:hypothetical protein